MSPKRVISTLSAGQGSWRAAKLARLLYPDAEHVLIFTDTLYEDADAYRFLLEGAANIVGRKLDWIPRAEGFPDYRVGEDVPIEEYCGNPEWRAFLTDLRANAAIDLPELVWMVEGRDPWEVYRDRRFVGNSRRDPCSDILKRKQLREWIDENGDAENDVLIFGIGSHEGERFDNGDGGGIRPRWAERGWRVMAPLAQLDYTPFPPELRLSWEDMPRGVAGLYMAPLSFYGLAPSRQYGLGYVHDNCGGNCCKAGMAHWQHRYRVQRDRALYDAMMERKLTAYLGQGTFLTDRTGGKKRPLPLAEFFARLDAQPSLIYDYVPGASGCGCMLDEAA